MLDCAKKNALASIARQCINEIALIKKRQKKKATKDQVVKVIKAKKELVLALGFDEQRLKYEIGIQSGSLKEKDDIPGKYEKSTGDGWIVFEDCEELRNKMKSHQESLAKMKQLLDSGMPIKSVAVEMAPSPEWVNYWRDRIHELINSWVI